MTRINGGAVIARALQAHGVKVAFTLHGGHLDPLYVAAAEFGIDLIAVRHEQAAGIAATGYSRSTGRVGVALATAGGGITNLVTAITNAYADCVPSVFIGGAPPLADVDALPVNSGYEQLSVVRGITKWHRQVSDVSHLAEAVERAFHWAQSGRPGPVYLEVPSDVMFALIDADSPSATAVPLKATKPAPSPAAVAEALELLSHADRPVILAGGGVAYAAAGNQLTAFAEAIGAPVLTNNKARGAISTTHPLSARGFSALAGATRAGTPADVVLIIGARRGIYTGGRRTPLIPVDATVIQVDVSAEELGRLGHTDLAIVSDAGEFLAAATAKAADFPSRDLSEWVQAVRGTPAQAAADATQSLTPRIAAAVVADGAPDDTIFVMDGGETPAWLDTAATVTREGRWLAHGYLGIMGEGMPLAVGAQVGNPDQTVILFTGDGAVGFNIAEFDTMVRHELPVIVVINNDAQWAMSSHGQDLIYGDGHRVVSELLPTRYDIVAQGFGLVGVLAETADELAAALADALQSRQPTCINVLTDAREVATVTKRMMGAAATGLVSDVGRARVPYADILEVG